MSTTTQEPDPISPDALRVLITGFGPFFHYAENPSWLAVRPLHNTTLYVQPSLDSAPPDQSAMSEDIELPPAPRQVHITTFQVPVTYRAVLSVVPGLHARPPVLPPTDDPSLPLISPPLKGFDFVLHVGVAGRGPLRLEKLGHKFGYRMKDAEGRYAPAVQLPKEGILVEPEAPQIEIERPPLGGLGGRRGGVLPSGMHGDVVEGNPSDGIEHQPSHGFGKGYENFPDELYTDLDVARLIHHLKEAGVEQVYSSMDAGHYLCDFIFYCSLAEAKRAAGKHEKDKTAPPKTIPVLCMHCPPVDQPLSTQEASEAIKRIVLWVCNKLV